MPATRIVNEPARWTRGGYGKLGNGRYPTPNWRPFADDSVFNTPVDQEAPSKVNSEAIIDRLTGPIGPSYKVGGDTHRDFGVAIYYSVESDPVYTITNIEEWGPGGSTTSELSGMEIYLPEGAVPSGGWPLTYPGEDWDSHITVVDQTNDMTYDIWNIQEINPGNPGEIVTKWSGMSAVDGDGLHGEAVAAEYAALAGLTRCDEFVRGRINHALTLTVPCTVGFQYPATKGGWECGTGPGEIADEDSLIMGDLLALDISDAEINTFPLWKRGLLKAWRKYGAYVSDTTGSQDWAIKWESPAGYTSMGFADPYVSVAQKLGMEAFDYNANGQPEYWFDVPGGVDWGSRLRVIDPDYIPGAP